MRRSTLPQPSYPPAPSGRSVGESSPRRTAPTALCAIAVAAAVAVAASASVAASVAATAGGRLVGAPERTSAVATSDDASGPAVSFAETRFSVPFFGYLWSDGDPVLTPAATPTNRANYFGQVSLVERTPDAVDMSFAVEGQSGGPFHQACAPDDACNDLAVQVTREGMLYLQFPRGSRQTRIGNTYLGGFATHAVELSAADDSSGLKIYREVGVDPPPEAAGCEDYSAASPEAYTCLFLRELLPSGQAASVDEADEAALRAKLPKLVQDGSNYHLVFAEEFNGAAPAADAAGCRDGLSTLDPAVWNYYDACDDVDSLGEPCGNVADGGFTMGIAGPCGFGSIAGFLLATQGHLHMKYGYIETQYTFDIDQWRGVYHNYNMILNVASRGLHYLRDSYGVEVNNWEDYLKTSQVEIDVFEMPSTHTANWQPEVSHQYGNWNGETDENLVRPTRTLKYTQYCARPAFPRERGIVNNPDACTDNDTFTVTRGLEWTPRGYRTYIWVHGLQDKLTLLPKDQISVQQKYQGVALTVKRRPKNQFFENLVPGDDSTLLEQAVVSHIPLPINLNIWGWLERDKHTHIKRRMTFDYVRVWKPANDYADMEPVYQ